MRVVSYGKNLKTSLATVDAYDKDKGFKAGDIGLVYADGTEIKAKEKPRSFVVLSTIPTKNGGVAIQRGVEINPYNMHYEVRKYDPTEDAKAKIVISGITNPALNPAQGVVYPADAEFVGGIEVASSKPYRAGLVENPNPQLFQLPIKIKATDTVDMLVEKIKKGLFLTTYNKEIFSVEVTKGAKGVDVTIEAVRGTALNVNLFGIVKEQEFNGIVKVDKTKPQGFLDCVADSDEDLRYSLINMGWNPGDEWQGKAWGLGDAKNGYDRVGYIVISTAEFNQFPEIAADRNSPRKYQIVILPAESVDAFAEKLKAIADAANAANGIGVELNTLND